MTDEYVHGKVQEALERQAEVRELKELYAKDITVGDMRSGSGNDRRTGLVAEGRDISVHSGDFDFRN